MARQARHGKAWMARLGKKARQARHGPDRLAGQGKAGMAWLCRAGHGRQGTARQAWQARFFIADEVKRDYFDQTLF